MANPVNPPVVVIPPINPPVDPPTDPPIPDPGPGLVLTKMVNGITDEGGGDGGNVVDEAGDVINYTITVFYTGDVALTNVTITDLLTGGLLATLPILAAGTISAVAASYEITQEDIDSNGTSELGDQLAGQIDNTATADSDQTDAVSSNSVAVDLVQAPALAIDKRVVGVDVDNDGFLDAPGDRVDYEIDVTNSGNQTLTNVTVSDPLTGGLLTTIAALAPGETETVLVSYALTQNDIDSFGTNEPDDQLAGQLDNTATADSDQTGPVTDSESVDIFPPVLAIGLSLTKAVTGITDNGGGDGGAVVDEAGDVINYALIVTNTGDVALTNVTVADPLAGGLLTTIATLAAGAEVCLLTRQ